MTSTGHRVRPGGDDYRQQERLEDGTAAGPGGHRKRQTTITLGRLRMHGCENFIYAVLRKAPESILT